jgi:alpha-D-ribose 1-methylphosphonate 5-triphosphate diphosphatase PhnM
MATENPGRTLGHRGILRVGETADIVRFTMDGKDKTMQIETVLVEGAELASQDRHAA